MPYLLYQYTCVYIYFFSSYLFIKSYLLCLFNGLFFLLVILFLFLLLCCYVLNVCENKSNSITTKKKKKKKTWESGWRGGGWRGWGWRAWEKKESMNEQRRKKSEWEWVAAWSEREEKKMNRHAHTSRGKCSYFRFGQPTVPHFYGSCKPALLLIRGNPRGNCPADHWRQLSAGKHTLSGSTWWLDLCQKLGCCRPAGQTLNLLCFSTTAASHRYFSTCSPPASAWSDGSCCSRQPMMPSLSSTLKWRSSVYIIPLGLSSCTLGGEANIAALNGQKTHHRMDLWTCARNTKCQAPLHLVLSSTAVLLLLECHLIVVRALWLG